MVDRSRWGLNSARRRQPRRAPTLGPAPAALPPTVWRAHHVAQELHRELRRAAREAQGELQHAVHQDALPLVPAVPVAAAAAAAAAAVAPPAARVGVQARARPNAATTCSTSYRSSATSEPPGGLAVGDEGGRPDALGRRRVVPAAGLRDAR